MNTTSRIFWGVGFISVAVFLILNQLGLITTDSINVWNIAIGFLSVAMFVSGLAKRSFGAMFFAVGMAYIAFGGPLGLPGINLWTMVVIVVLLTIGFNFIFPKKQGAGKRDWSAYENEDQIGEHQKVKTVDEDGYVTCANTFGALAKYVNTSDFKGGKFSNSFGELKVYLDQANIVNGPVTVNIANSFGKMELYIPREWSITRDVSIFAGNVEEKNRGAGANGPILNLVGNLSFGDIVIIYV